MATMVFYDANLPFSGARPGAAELAHWQTYLCNSMQLAARLPQAGRGDVLIYTHGAEVDVANWPAILAFLARGGHIITLGAKLLSSVQGTPQAGYFRQIHIHEALEVDTSSGMQQVAARKYPWLAGFESLFGANAPTSGLVLMPTKDKDCPSESGSSGPMDVMIEPLLQCLDAQGNPIAAPVVLLENHRGQFAGSRFVLVNIDPDPLFWREGGALALLNWAHLASAGATEIWIKPDFACYQVGEVASIAVQIESLQAPQDWVLEMSVWQQAEQIARTTLLLAAQEGLRTARFTLPSAVQAGYYAIKVTATSQQGEVRQLEQGFWGWDEALLQTGSRLTAGRDYFERDGQPVPIVGMTYMASDVHRKFLQLPNVAAWQQDMAQFAQLGINYIRTGIWTAWRQVMFVDGHAQEAALRAIDAFILTASQHGLETCFTFFAFTPESWEGTNPYLDPRSRAAQKRFIASIVSRHTASTKAHWDLINEPSMFDPQRIFIGPRTLRDAHEVAAFRTWLQQQNSDLAHWRRRWDRTSADLASWSDIVPPQPEDVGFNTTENLNKQHGIWLDYALFSQAMHTEWAGDLARYIKQIAPSAMVTVGQDECLGQQRPSPFFFADTVDYTNVHSWWLNDDLLWDSIFSKTPNKPSLVQETGIMHVETPAGRSKRSETELAHLLERKYAFAFANGGAGAVQWIWNINYHMDNINESHIGACRADGSHKPEVNVSRDFGAFFAPIAPLLQARRLEDIAIVYPFSNDYGNRRFALEATQRLVRVMQYELKQPVRAISEYDIAALVTAPARLIIVPSAHALTQQAWDGLQQLLDTQNVTVLLTGPLDLDESWLPAARSPFGDEGVQTTNLRREECVQIGEQKHRLSYGGDKIAKLFKGVFAQEQISQLHSKQYAAGVLLWCPQPIEMNERTDAIAALYQYALAQCAAAGWPVRNDLAWQGDIQAGVMAQKLAFEQGALWILVNESAQDECVEWLDRASAQTYRTVVESERAVLIATNTAGAVIGSLRNHLVELL